MLSNAILAGAIAAAYVVVLVLQLNPTLPLHPARLAPLALAVGVFYAVHLTAIAYAILLVRQIFGRDLFSPAWTSVRVLAWLGSIAAACGAAVMWANVRTFDVVLEPRTITAMLQGAIVLAAAALLLLITALLPRYGGRRRVWALVVGLIIAGSVALPVALRGRAMPSPLDSQSFGNVLDVPPSDRSARVTMIALDAGSLDVITSAAAEGRLPNFGRILDAGAVTHLATLHPTSAEAVWAAIATGKLPQKNGIRSAAVYRWARQPAGDAIQLLPDFCFATGLLRLGILTEEPRTSASLRAKPLWAILSAAAISVGVVNVPLTHPAPAVRGFVVSDAYARVTHAAAGPADPKSFYPPDLPSEVSFAEALASAADAASPTLPAALDGRYQAAARTDRLYAAVQRRLLAAYPTHVSIIRYQSLDPIGHYFLRYAMPSRFGDVSDEDRRRHGGVLEAHYAIVDEALGLAIADLGPEDLLIVVSGFGMEPLGIGKRVLERLIGDPDLSGSHERAPDGFLMAYGASVARGRQLRRASIVDVLPTLLYFLGLPVGRDMDGYARPDLFVPEFTAERPITFIPTYER